MIEKMQWKMSMMAKELSTGMSDRASAVMIWRMDLMRAKRRRTRKARRHRRTLAGRLTGPREMRDMLTMKKSKRHHASVQNWMNQWENMLTTSSKVKMAVNAVSRRSRKMPVGVLVPSSLSRAFGPSSASAAVAAKFCVVDACKWWAVKA